MQPGDEEMTDRAGEPAPVGDGTEADIGPGTGTDPDEAGPVAFMRALRVPRNAAVGLVVGTMLTVVVYVLFVLVPGSARSPLWYLGLGIVLATATAGLVATLLTLLRAVALSRQL